MPNNFEMNKVLYYPSIEFQSETWVKAALLFWNKIYRISPYSYEPNDSDEIKEAVQGGFIENINMNEIDLKDTADEFMEFCDKLRLIPSGFADSKFETRLHDDKVDERLKSYFRNFNWKFDKEGFHHLPSEIVNGYMFFLSKTISSRRNMPKLSDDPDMYTAMTYFDNEGSFNELIQETNSKEMYTNLIIENMIPADIKSIKMDTILKLSTDFKHLKDEFRDTVSEFSKSLRNVSDLEFAQKQIKEFEKKLLENRMTRMEYLRKFSRNLIPSLLYTGIPTFTASLVTSGIFTQDNLFGMRQLFQGAIMAGVTSLATSGRAVVNNWKPKNSSYYMEIKSHLTSEESSRISSYQNFSYRLDEYIND